MYELSMIAFWTDLIVELLLRNHTPFLIFVNLCVKRSRSLISHAILHWHFCVNPLSPNVQKQILQTDLHTFL